MKKNDKLIVPIAFVMTYIITHIIYKVTGFYYGFEQGLFNFKALLDLGVWCIVYFIIYMPLKKIWNR